MNKKKNKQTDWREPSTATIDYQSWICEEDYMMFGKIMF